MPIYEYECQRCGAVFERVFSIESFPNQIICGGNCDGVAIKIISRVQNMKPDWEPYYDENLDVHVRGRGHRNEVMKAQGLTERDLSSTKRRINLEERNHKIREAKRNGIQ